MWSRRKVLKVGGQLAAAPLVPGMLRFETMGKGSGAIRCINVVNFIRGVEPRFKTDLLEPVRKQMELVLQHKLPATWLLQFDALAAGPFVEFLKANMAQNHEVGTWFEMNQMHCEAAGVEWRGRPGYEWDHLPPVAFTIGYTPEERIKLADAAMAKFHEVWGRYPSSVASWNLDSITIAHLIERYGVDAFAVCRDQIATDGFTIWGAPIAGYYPSKVNCWSPALDAKNQLSSPVFRMLGQDPVYYYQREFKLPSGRVVREPDTMEPTWTAGQTDSFVEAFLTMIAKTSTEQFAYAQLGQENSFPWPGTAEAYPKQMAALAKLRETGKVHVETMGESGRRFKRAFKETPAQAQIMLEDPFGNTDPAQGSIWYQSRFYRANLHLKGDVPYFRDITVYNDHLPQPFLQKATRQNDVEQRMPAVVDGYHWSKNPGAPDEAGAGGYLFLEGQPVRLAGKPIVHESIPALEVELPLVGGRKLVVYFDERMLQVQALGGGKVELRFNWDANRGVPVRCDPQLVTYTSSEGTYEVHLLEGKVAANGLAWTVENQGRVRLSLAQQ